MQSHRSTDQGPPVVAVTRAAREIAWGLAALLGGLCGCQYEASGPTIYGLSPGPLSKAHRSVDGPLACKQCHSTQTEIDPKKCTAGCHVSPSHKKVESELRDRTGFHGSPCAQAEFKQGGCARCHIEHRPQPVSTAASRRLICP